MLENDKLICKDLPWERMMDALAYALVFKANSPLQSIMASIHPPFSADERHDLLRYIKNQGEAIPDCVQRSDINTRDLFALYRASESVVVEYTQS